MPTEDARHAPVILLGAEVPAVQALAIELSRSRRVAAIAITATLPGAWPFPDANGPERQGWLYPPGFNRRLRLFFDPVVRGRLNRLRRRLDTLDGQEPVVLAPLPAFLHYVRDVPGHRLVYWNYDDYTGDGTRALVVARESALLTRAGTILCSSRYQRDRFRATRPDKAHAIEHFPHGVAEAAFNPDPSTVPARRVCAVGHLTSRYDWPLIRTVAARLPDVEFRFVGELDTSGSAPGDDWTAHAAACLALPNVVQVGETPYHKTFAHAWDSAAVWLPYRPDLPFVRASCPVKLGDGLASGRAVISADLPEARLYPERVRCFSGADEAARLIAAAITSAGAPADAGRAAAQVAFARTQTWTARAAALDALLARPALGRAQ